MKIGLEIHRRLDTNKLFCECPSATGAAEAAKPDIVINRRLHPVFSELGELDEASRVEFAKDRTFLYQVWNNCNCLVESDEEPPHDLNPDALNIALEVAMQLHAAPVEEVHVMRKIVIDGSNTSGFQRTAIVAMDGYVDTSKGRISIPLIALEEESAGIVKSENGTVLYRLDRLGIPLIEISTTPDIKDAEHLGEVAEKIGMVLLATGKVARGLGTIRQDVNVSTEHGARVEIKGAQDLRMLPLLVKNEVLRQERLLEVIAEIKKRFNGAPKFSRIFTDVTDVFGSTNSAFIKNAIQRSERAFAVLLPKHASMLGKELQPNRRYGSELSDYAKQAGIKGILHSDEDLSKYGLSETEINKIKAIVNATNQSDAFVMVLADAESAKHALNFVLDRAEMMYVPEETRRAAPDATTTYLRPLPGRARMYPETDVMPIPITKKRLVNVKKSASISLEELRKRLIKQLNPEMAENMLRSKNLGLYEKLVAIGVEPMLVAITLENTLVSLRREGVVIKEPESLLIELFTQYMKGTFAKAAIAEILRACAAENKPVGIVIKEKNLAKISGLALEKIAGENHADIKKIMSLYRLRIDPAELNKVINSKKRK
jgi:glutamyl-tRNA(Gln) amidotransferase subunit E